MYLYSCNWLGLVGILNREILGIDGIDIYIMMIKINSKWILWFIFYSKGGINICCVEFLVRFFYKFNLLKNFKRIKFMLCEKY